MKYNALLCLLLIVLLSLQCVSAARLSVSFEPAAVLSGISKANNVLSKQGVREGRTEENNTWQLMGMEECKQGDEECEKRRLLTEAHLDYIYTQGHHKQP